jgi:hypothetical protein
MDALDVLCQSVSIAAASDDGDSMFHRYQLVLLAKAQLELALRRYSAAKESLSAADSPRLAVHRNCLAALRFVALGQFRSGAALLSELQQQLACDDDDDDDANFWMTRERVNALVQLLAGSCAPSVSTLDKSAAMLRQSVVTATRAMATANGGDAHWLRLATDGLSAARLVGHALEMSARVDLMRGNVDGAARHLSGALALYERVHSVLPRHRTAQSLYLLSGAFILSIQDDNDGGGNEAVDDDDEQEDNERRRITKRGATLAACALPLLKAAYRLATSFDDKAVVLPLLIVAQLCATPGSSRRASLLFEHYRQQFAVHPSLSIQSIGTYLAGLLAWLDGDAEAADMHLRASLRTSHDAASTNNQLKAHTLCLLAEVLASRAEHTRQATALLAAAVQLASAYLPRDVALHRSLQHMHVSTLGKSSSLLTAGAPQQQSRDKSTHAVVQVLRSVDPSASQLLLELI